ncbi:MAG: WhiB family transcriptional regulator [Humibacillus sp.]|nr:WhiB family transcriptional regulator [Humibacillus sp.]MDN5778030.1 WhiB family transcriptional regulator [Humibacillus sp.]
MTTTSLRTSEWVHRAACVGVSPETFSSEDLPASGTVRRSTTAAAKAVCAMCPVSAECLRYALENRVEYGVWGGFTGAERQQIARSARGVDRSTDRSTDGGIDRSTDRPLRRHRSAPGAAPPR